MTSTRYEREYHRLRTLVDRELAAIVRPTDSHTLFKGSHYVLAAPGKRIRPVLLLLSCKAVGGRVADALNAAVAIEMLHNFTLVHDDVMDNAPSRRGRPTVHTQWNVNNAILIGDFILGLAYRKLANTSSKAATEVFQLFTEGFVDVCEGQALDLEFEHRKAIALHDYYTMIGKKTGRLISVCTELGGVLGRGTAREVNALKAFGTHIGRAFQIQDDLLDVVGEESRFGKSIGGDIIARKKTFLLVKALLRSRGRDRRVLRQFVSGHYAPLTPSGNAALVREISDIYHRTGVVKEARQQIRRETTAGLRMLDVLPQSNAKAMLLWFSGMLVARTS